MMVSFDAYPQRGPTLASSTLQSGRGLTVDRARDHLHAQLGVRWRTGDRLPTVDELADDMGVGRVNVLRAVRMLVEEGYLESRPRLGTVVISEMPSAVKVLPGSAAAGVQNRMLQGKTVRVLSPSLQYDSFSREAVTAVCNGLDALGADVQLLDVVHHSPAMMNLTLHDAADAVVTINPRHDALQNGRDDQLLTVITTGADYEPRRAGRYDIVGVDSAQGGFLAGRYLRDLDVGPIGFLGVASPEGGLERTSAARLAAMVNGLGSEVEPAHTYLAKHYCLEWGAMVVPDYLQTPDRPAALFAASDDLAVGFIYGMHGRGLRPGADYHIVGFDGQTRGRGLAGGPLTTVKVSMKQMGELAVEMLVDRFAQPDRPVRRVQLGCEMFEGGTAVKKESS